MKYVAKTVVIHTTSGVHREPLELRFETMQPKKSMNMHEFRKWAGSPTNPAIDYLEGLEPRYD